MSLEAAKRVLTEVNRDTFAGKSEEELGRFLQEKGYDCTVEELKKARILGEHLSETELEKVTGGRGHGKRFSNNGCSHAAKKNSDHELGRYADGDGGCAADYYLEPCSDTVEKDSFCWSGDYDCFFSGRHYTVHCLTTQTEPASGGSATCFGPTG